MVEKCRVRADRVQGVRGGPVVRILDEEGHGDIRGRQVSSANAAWLSAFWQTINFQIGS
ncbi:hypothetical protein MAPG_11893 [Magnaporthiopsis poae ATCC 64411]|uniref:Uncharacterized protein n=1 Tax=Magnaporthiopsis poae (strain ATCC 64411 / 73-15) TaxID=644358 RepID=A0A0C4EGF4_MAGP6|nr:hypothetical protein MAPG_11893 [Magnaporthiopsis poae ATCC 64411]